MGTVGRCIVSDALSESDAGGCHRRHASRATARTGLAQHVWRCVRRVLVRMCVWNRGWGCAVRRVAVSNPRAATFQAGRNGCPQSVRPRCRRGLSSLCGTRQVAHTMALPTCPAGRTFGPASPVSADVEAPLSIGRRLGMVREPDSLRCRTYILAYNLETEGTWREPAIGGNQSETPETEYFQRFPGF